VRRHPIAPEDRRYGSRTSLEIRSTLLALTLEFVRAARAVAGVKQIALLGSILTPKPRPKDVDLLVVLDRIADLAALATLGRRLKGGAQSKLNSGADVFLADQSGHYHGRVCSYRECHPRALCQARHCGAIQHLRDDLDLLTLANELTVSPPVELYPAVVTRVVVPGDVEELLLAAIRRDAAF
jgi:predicted nucleotidyltransferase